MIGKKIPGKFTRGRKIRAAALNEIVEKVSDGVDAPKQGANVAAAVRVARFTIVSISADYLSCRPVNTPGGSLVYVARPYLVRSRASHAGISYTYTDAQNRSASDGVDTEDQRVTPLYVAGDEIKAVRVIGGTGVTAADGASIVYEDQNNDARQWAKVI